MAVIYDFTLYRLSNVLRSISQHTGGVVRDLHHQGHQLTRLQDGFRTMGDMMEDFASALGHHREHIAKSIAYNRSCQEAVESTSLSHMIAVRDRLLQTRGR